LVLTNNIFEFNGKKYRQKQGTAIGTKMAPPYAILFMAALEESFLQECIDKPSVWWRFIDDIFMIWPHGEEKLDQFFTHLNSFHPTIKFTSERSRETINFLDVQVSWKNKTLITDLYVKPTDTHQYLHPSSCHPYHCKKAIPYSQALRLNRICSREDDFENRCEDLCDWLIDRGYKPRLVEEQIQRACQFDRNELLTRTSKKSDNKLSLNLNYNPAFRNLGSIMRELQPILAVDSEHRQVFTETPIVGFSNGRNLKSFLVKSKLPESKTENEKTQGCLKCGGGTRRSCKVCDHIKETTTFISNVTNESFTIRKGPLDCNSKFVVYLVNCKVCSIQNVGSTITKYRIRMNNYKNVHRKYRLRWLEGKPERVKEGIICQEKFHKHFCSEGHTGIGDWEIILIDQASSEKSLRQKELFWQYKLQTFFPLGLNEIEAPVDIS
jgi:hypothetical protein